MLVSDIFYIPLLNADECKTDFFLPCTLFEKIRISRWPPLKIASCIWPWPTSCKHEQICHSCKSQIIFIFTVKTSYNVFPNLNNILPVMFSFDFFHNFKYQRYFKSLFACMSWPKFINGFIKCLLQWRNILTIFSIHTFE